MVYTTTQAAEQLGISPIGVRMLIWRRIISPRRFGRDFAISETEMVILRNRRAPGRPKSKKPFKPKKTL
jgi:hypothetical protein